MNQCMEGPSLVILKEEMKPFKGKKITKASGYASIDYDRITGQTVKDFKTWGKQFIIQFREFAVRIHFLMFGSYRINDAKKGSNAKLSLKFSNGVLNCYVCSVKFIDEPLNDVYDWSLDMMSDKFSAAKVKKLVLQKEKETIGDVLLDAEIFSGVGNIIKNEVLYRQKVHPDSKVEALPSRKITSIINEARKYSFEFLKWKKKNELKRHWEIYTKNKCPLGHKVVKKYTGKKKRRSFICECMVKYN